MVHFIVDGGHRAIIFSRIGGIQDNIYTEGLHFRYSTAWSNLFTYCHNENITCVCMMHSFLSEMCISLSAQENSWHLATLPVVSPPNDVWETSAEISHWWHVTTQIWVVLLIGCDACEIWFNQSEKSELKHRKNHKSLLSGRFGDPYSRLGDFCRIWETQVQITVCQIYSAHLQMKLEIAVKYTRNRHTVVYT